MRLPVAILLLALFPGAAAAVNSTFSYQGTLQDAGVAANGSYDLRFELQTSGGASLGVILKDDVAVNAGRFSVELDFGPVITGSDYQLQIGVRPGVATGAFTPMSPATRIRPTPQAQVAGIATEAVAVSSDSISSTSIANGSVGAIDIDASQVQRRIATACGSSEAIRAIAADGGVSCVAGGDGGTRVYGDGSRGPLVVNGSAILDSANLQFDSITVAVGATLTVPSGALVRVRGAVTIDGLLTVTQGASAALQIGQHPAPANHFGHSAFGGVGESSSSGVPAFGSPGIGGREANYFNASAAAQLAIRPQVLGGGPGGSGGGTGGEGGGFVTLLAQGPVVLRGDVRADGRAPSSLFGRGAGGGGGGLLVIASRTSIQNTGFIYALGGNGSPAGSSWGGSGQAAQCWGAGGGGGGGLVHLIAPSIEAGRVSTTGGTGGATASAVTYPSAAGFQCYGGGGGGATYGRGGGGNSAMGEAGSQQVTFGGAGQSGAVGALLQTVSDPTGLF